jgi:hypothetical protein
MELAIFIYILLNVVAFAVYGFVADTIDKLEDVKVWHIIYAVVFFLATIGLIIIFCVFFCFLMVKEFFQKKRTFSWLHKPVFKKKQK